MRLWEYEGKRVRITSHSGQVFVGLADIYHDAEDNESGISSLAIELDNNKDGPLIGFEETEIASIEIIPDSIPAAAIPA